MLLSTGYTTSFLAEVSGGLQIHLIELNMNQTRVEPRSTDNSLRVVVVVVLPCILLLAN